MSPLNFRDVGEALSLWMEPCPLPPHRLYRGGRIDDLARLEDLGFPKTIINLRTGPDPGHLNARMMHLPAPNNLENYETSMRGVAAWLRAVLDVLADPATEWPVYLHCTSGRDRTGVVVATVLHLAGFPHQLILDEYMLSDGAQQQLMSRALKGLDTFRYGDTERNQLCRTLGLAGGACLTPALGA